MNNKELYQQKMQARLDEWKAEVDKLKARSSGASADVQLDVNRQIRVLESAWDALKSGVTDAAAKFKR